jgi:hypothetical protein
MAYFAAMSRQQILTIARSHVCTVQQDRRQSGPSMKPHIVSATGRNVCQFQGRASTQFLPFVLLTFAFVVGFCFCFLVFPFALFPLPSPLPFALCPLP